VSITSLDVTSIVWQDDVLMNLFESALSQNRVLQSLTCGLTKGILFFGGQLAVCAHALTCHRFRASHRTIEQNESTNQHHRLGVNFAVALGRGISSNVTPFQSDIRQ